MLNNFFQHGISYDNLLGNILHIFPIKPNKELEKLALL